MNTEPGIFDKDIPIEFRRDNIVDNQTEIIGGVAFKKDKFFKILEAGVKYVDKKTYVKSVGKDTSPAHFNLDYRGGSLDVMNGGVRIFVNKDAFKVGDRDYSDLIPIAVRHEVYEVWARAKSKSLRPGLPSEFLENAQDEAHKLAVVEACAYALKLGKGDRYLEFINEWSLRLKTDHAQQFVNENIEVVKTLKGMGY